MPNYNNSIKRTVQNLLFEGINSKRVIGLAGPTPEEYMDILQNHAKEVYVCDYEPSRTYVERTSLIGLYQLKNPSWVDADFCSSIIDNWNDILYIWKELQMSKFQTVYFTFNVSLRTGHSHEYTYDWIKKNIMDFNIVNTQTIKGDGREYIKKHTTDNPDIMLIEYFSTSYMLSVRLKYEWKYDIPIKCKRIILSSHRICDKNRLIKSIYKCFENGYIPNNICGGKERYSLLLRYTNLPYESQYKIGITKRVSGDGVKRYKIFSDLMEFINKYGKYPTKRTNPNLINRVYKIRKNPKYSEIIKELEIKYNHKKYLSEEDTLLELKEYLLKYNELPKFKSLLYKRMWYYIVKSRKNSKDNEITKLYYKYKTNN